jgi:hypothetical protein
MAAGLEVTVKALALLGLPPSPREAHLLIALDAHRVVLLGGGSISPVSGPQQFNDLVYAPNLVRRSHDATVYSVRDTWDFRTLPPLLASF